MIDVTDLKNGTTFLLDKKAYQVIKYSHIKMGRGKAVVKVTARNLSSGSIEEKSFSSDSKVDSVNTYKRKLQYLYQDVEDAVFVDPSSYEQVGIPKRGIAKELPFIKEGENVDIHFWDDKPLSLDLPPKVVLEVAQTDPGVKGNSATNIYKPAKLENGLKTKVPLFIKTGDKIKVDTRTGEYVERVKE
ncbi:MAG: elongation factor P [Patescibacteria group bacterium]